MEKYKVEYTNKFSKNYKRMKKQQKDMSKLKEAVKILASGEKLPQSYRDHALIGNQKDYRECHLEGDWLLKYRIIKNQLILVLCDTGSHSSVLRK